MLRALVDARRIVALAVAGAVGIWGLSAYPFVPDNAFLGLIAAMPSEAQGLAEEAAVLERRVKAVFVFKFAAFVEWPTPVLAEADTIQIAVMGEQAIVQDYLRDGAHLYEWIDRNYVRSLLAEHFEHRADHGQRLWLLLTIELWLRSLRTSRSAAPLDSAAMR